MGAGKTTVGQEMSLRFNLRFVDLDEVIVKSSGKTIPEIFAEEGEAGFRRRETECLTHLLQQTPDRPEVIALGGGAFVQPANLEVIHRCSIPCVFLDAPIDTLLLRCRSEKTIRPLAHDENHFRQLYEQRRIGYMKADHRVQTAGKAVREIVNEVISRLGWCDEVSEVPESH
ncbi:MAG TPA: shikimate kinase [Terriglobales bacterium]|nr:shikimate kinase [Terriglobales bacterium]